MNTLTITDTIPTISIAGPSSVIEGAQGSFTVTLSKASSSTVTVSYSTQNGTALGGTDFTATSGTLTFLSGETSQNVSVSTLG
ncbi:MAG: hypothetical protein HC883_02600, partial [Bdellovibrionaceae bacterium]|nr:hypothetical protein [Pseudobdellovibrionaceae bacterium]